MRLFDKIPENFFSILVSQNKNIYVDALFVLQEAFNQEMSIPKNNLISRLINSLDDEFKNADFSEEDDMEEIKENNSSAKAHLLLRKLKWAGWIEIEMQRDSFEEYVILPDYSIKFIEVLDSIVNEKQTEYNSYVYGTYSSLRIAMQEKERTYEAINATYNNTNSLILELKSLYNNLGRYHRIMYNADSINDILKEHFSKYKQYSDERIYPLVTRDSIPRYKAPIREMLTNILTNEELLRSTINTEVARKRYKDDKEAESDILYKIRRVLEIYKNIDDTMNQIELKNNDYVRASVHRIQYLLTSDKELKGKLINILKNSDNEKVIQLMEQEAKLLKQEYLSSDSVYTRNTKDKKEQGESLKIEEQENIDEEVLSKFKEELSKLYSSKRINEFMEANFKDKPFIHSSEIELKNTEDLILLILATVKADKTTRGFYYTEDSDQTIDNNGYKIPNIKFIRRK